SSGFSRTSAGTQSRSIRRIRAVRRPRASCRSDRSALLAPAPETGGSWLAAGCASISRWNAKIRPTNHARSRRLGADVGARRTAPPGSTAPRQLTYGPLYALSADAVQRARRADHVFRARRAAVRRRDGGAKRARHRTLGRRGALRVRAAAVTEIVSDTFFVPQKMSDTTDGVAIPGIRVTKPRPPSLPFRPLCRAAAYGTRGRGTGAHRSSRATARGTASRASDRGTRPARARGRRR